MAKNKKTTNDSFDKRDDDDMEFDDSENEKGFNADALDEALDDGDDEFEDEDESLDELEKKEYEDMEFEDDILLNNDEENPFWKL